MATTNPFLLLIIIITIIRCCFDHHLTAAAAESYKYTSPLNLTVALTVMVPFGTPSQFQRVVLDTGSQLTWLQCRTSIAGLQPSFRPNESSSFSNIRCEDPACVTNPVAQISDLSLPMRCLHNHCRYTSSYADSTTSSGNLVREKSDLSHHLTPSLIIGCSPSKDLFTGADGILGMNRGNLSFVSQANITKFSYCVPNLLHNNIGTFYIGDSPYSETFRNTSLVNTSVDSQSIGCFDPFQYYVHLSGIIIRGENLTIVNQYRFACLRQTMIDSGTMYTYLVDAAYNAVRKKVLSLTGNHMMEKSPDVIKEFDMCYKPNSNLTEIMEEIGDVVFEFGGGVNVTIAKEIILHNITGFGACVAFGRAEALTFTTNVFGFLYQQDHCLEFQGSQVGFGKADDHGSKA